MMFRMKESVCHKGDPWVLRRKGLLGFQQIVVEYLAYKVDLRGAAHDKEDDQRVRDQSRIMFPSDVFDATSRRTDSCKTDLESLYPLILSFER